MVPVGKSVTREAFGLVLTLPHSGAHATVFTLGRTVADLRVALVACLEWLGGVPEKLVHVHDHDHDPAIVASREDGRARLHPEVAALLGALRTKAVPLAPGGRPPRAKSSA